MRIECMCVGCHGPIPLKQRKLTAMHCEEETCRALWHRTIKKGLPIPHTYHWLRAYHQMRREHEATIERVGLLAGILDPTQTHRHATPRRPPSPRRPPPRVSVRN